jgi:long-chain fatty acid transport protein
MNNVSKRHLFSFAAVLALYSSADAAGFAIIENSASGMGTAFASGGAAGVDASTMWFNPASMSLLKGNQALIAAHAILPTADFKNNNSKSASGAALSGEVADGGKSAVVPNFYYVNQLSDTWHFGLGITAPFGLGTHYNDDWIGRYHAVETDLKTINVNPAISYKIGDRFTIGYGANIQYVDVTLTSAVDFGALLGTEGGADGFGNLHADNATALGYGWNIGFLYELSKETRFSLAYRSEIKHSVKGRADFIVPQDASAVVSQGAFVDTDLSASVDLPATLSLSAFQNIDAIDIMADVTWMGWSSFKELRVKYDNPLQPDSVTTENYQDQLRFALGASYHVDELLTFRTGVAYDQKAVKNEKYRTPRIPDNNRLWVSLGAGYKINDALTMDIGYSHLFVKETKIDNTFESSNSAVNHTLKGTYTASVDILSTQIVWKF